MRGRPRQDLSSRLTPLGEQASVSTYLTQLYHATRDELEGAVADESATGVPASGKKGRAARWQPVANPPSLPELSEDVEAEATGQVGAVEG